MSAEPPAGGFRLWMVIPVIGALMVMAVFLLGLEREDGDTLPSALIGQPAPQFTLAPLMDSVPGLNRADLDAPGVKLVNIWASWCAPCRAEHPNLITLKEKGIPIFGINYKDLPDQARAFLKVMGNPFARIGADQSGRAGIEWGVYGVPETYVIDARGQIIYRHVGPITSSDVENKILPAIARAEKQDPD